MNTEIATKFKDTDIGVIPKEWTVLNVGEIGKVVTGKTPPTNNQEYYGDDYPFVKIPDMTGSVYINKTNTRISQKGADYLGKAKIPKNSIMVSCIATVGNVGITSEDSFTNQQINSLIPNENIADFKYLYYFFKSNKDLLESLGGGGSVYTNISKSKFESMPVILPRLSEQKIISEILASLDDKIELIKSININLEKLSSCLFKQYFVDSKNDWPTKKLSDLADITIGRTPPRMQFEWFSENPKDIKWISIRDLGCSGVFINRTSEYLTKEAVEKFNIPLIPKKTVILSFKLTVGRVAITAEEMLSNEAIAHIKITDLNISPEYIYFILKRFDYSGLGTTSSIANAVNSKTIKDMDIPLADDQTIKKFTSLVAPIFDLILENTKKLESLTEIKELILPKLMSGNIRVK